ncbi:hypothetical protein TNCV_2363481 [Trichonephila clavipes]|nr:hypothetical protein TNCV_2363481 [Trichonephila clavipes]
MRLNENYTFEGAADRCGQDLASFRCVSVFRMSRLKPTRDDSSVSSNEAFNSDISFLIKFMPSAKEPENKDATNVSSVTENSLKSNEIKFESNALAVFCGLILIRSRIGGEREDDIEELIIGHEDELTIELQEILNEEHQEIQRNVSPSKQEEDERRPMPTSAIKDLFKKSGCCQSNSRRMAPKPN